MNRPFAALFAAAATLAASPAVAAVTFINAHVATSPTGQIGTVVNGTIDDIEATSDLSDEHFADTLQNLTASVAVDLEMVRDSQLLADLAGNTSASIAFTDAANGVITIGGNGHVDHYATDLETILMQIFAVSYVFSVDTASVLTVDYVDSLHFQLTGPGVGFNGVPGGVQGSNGSLNFNLGPGVYAMRAQGGVDILRATGFGGHTDSLASTLDFTIAEAVPEPSTWAMMILGFGAAGAMLRRRTALTA